MTKEWWEGLKEKVEKGELSSKEVVEYLAQMMILSPVQRRRLLGDSQYQKKFNWWKEKVLATSDLSQLLRFFYWLRRQPDLFPNEQAVLGAVIRRLENMAHWKRQF